MNSLTIQTLRIGMFFLAIALSMFDYLAERTDPLTSEQVTLLHDMYLEHESAPFPNHLFRYMNRPELGRIQLLFPNCFKHFIKPQNGKPIHPLTPNERCITSAYSGVDRPPSTNSHGVNRSYWDGQTR